jgi:hypothetical protein
MDAAATGQDLTKLEIEIVGGLHKGAKLSLHLGDYTVGSTPDADIVIRDADVDAEHAILRVDRWAVHVEAVGGDVAVGEKLIMRGHGCRVRMPNTIVVGNARLELKRAGEASVVPEALRPITQVIASRPLLVAAGIVGCALVFSVASTGFPMLTTTPEPKVTGTTSQEAVSDEMVKEAASKTKEKFLSAGVTSVNVTAADKRIVVSGAVSKRDAGAVASTERWFDETYGSRIVLTTNLNVSEKVPAFRLQAVWYGERPYVILEDGRHIYEGATMDNGWRLQKIANDRVLLNKDGESLALTYR